MTGSTGRFDQTPHIREQSMTTLSDPPKGGFRLSMLINDTRYRAYTFQFIALVALIVAFGYLGSNLLSNLKAAGLNISYKFLGDPAGYDINQRLIEYSSQSTHLRAAVVGMLNRGSKPAACQVGQMSGWSALAGASLSYARGFQ